MRELMKRIPVWAGRGRQWSGRGTGREPVGLRRARLPFDAVGCVTGRCWGMMDKFWVKWHGSPGVSGLCGVWGLSWGSAGGDLHCRSEAQGAKPKVGKTGGHGRQWRTARPGAVRVRGTCWYQAPHESCKAVRRCGNGTAEAGRGWESSPVWAYKIRLPWKAARGGAGRGAAAYGTWRALHVALPLGALYCLGCTTATTPWSVAHVTAKGQMVWRLGPTGAVVPAVGCERRAVPEALPCRFVSVGVR